MKAIRTRYVGQTDRMPARWKAEDGDGNKAIVSASTGTAADAVEALCQRMGWVGELVSGGFGNDEFWVWVEPGSPLLIITGTAPQQQKSAEEPAVLALTEEQEDCLRTLHLYDCHILAETTEQYWRRGEHYYVDERVSIPKRLRQRIGRINDKLLAAEDARFEAAKKKGGDNV